MTSASDQSPLWTTCTVTPTHLDLRDPDGVWDAVVKADGCVQLFRSFNNPAKPADDTPADLTDDADSLHICDLDDAIARLQEIKRLALAHFGVWPT